MKKIDDLKETNPKAYIGTVICMVIFIVIMTALPIAMIVIGSLNLNKCAIEQKIPVWLIVSGSVSIFMAILITLSLIAQIVIKRSAIFAATSCLLSIIAIFQVAWLITGNVWVYSNYSTVIYNDILSPKYCDRTVYLFAFWVMTAGYIAFGAFIVIGILFGCCCLLGSCLCLGKSK